MAKESRLTRVQRWRKANPLRYAYQNLKGNAKRRGKVFDLTFDEFKQFAVKTEYIGKKGRTAESYHVDRIDPARGYTINNIQVLTNSENMRKHMIAYWNGRRVLAKTIKIYDNEQEQAHNSPF
jgi:hypothetical protein